MSETKDENPLLNDINSADLGLEKNKFPLKYVIIVGGILILVFTIIIILIIAFSNKNSSPDSKTDNDDNGDRHENQIEIGNIYCKYDIGSENIETKILGDEFNKISDFDIYINGNKIKYSKVYKFSSYGLTDIEIKLYGNLNMDYMFKGISSLKSVEMKSSNNAKINSMISTF